MASRATPIILGVAMVAALAVGGTTIVLAQANTEPVLKERSNLMKSFNENNKLIAAAVKSGEVDAKVAKAAEDISAGAKKITALFPAGTGDDKVRTRAKPGIWQDWSKFEANAKDLEGSFAAAAAAAKAGDKAGVEAGFTKGNQVCTACHKDFRGPALK
jgi:cytochrome c556